MNGIAHRISVNRTPFRAFWEFGSVSQLCVWGQLIIAQNTASVAPITSTSHHVWTTRSRKKNKFSHFLVVVQLIHRQTTAVQKRLICSFSRCLLNTQVSRSWQSLTCRVSDRERSSSSWCLSWAGLGIAVWGLVTFTFKSCVSQLSVDQISRNFVYF